LAWGVCVWVIGGAIVRRWAVWDGGRGGCGAQSGNHGLHYMCKVLSIRDGT